MTKARTLANFISDNNEFADGTISVAEVSGAAPLASPSFTGSIVMDGTVTHDSSNGTQPFYITRSGATNQTGRLYADDSTFVFDSIQDETGGAAFMFRSTNASVTNQNVLELNPVGVFVNQDGANQDFRIEGDNNSNLFFVDASVDSIGIGTNTPRSNLMLDVAGDIGQTWIDGEQFVGQQYSSGGYRLGIITDSTDRTAQLVANAGDNNGKLEFYVNANRAGLVSSASDWTFFEGATFNENGQNKDFRVESDGNSHGLFVDAGNNGVGIFNSADTNLANLAIGLTGAVISGDTDGATIGKGGIAKLINGNNFSSSDATVFLLGGGSGGTVGQISSGFGFARHNLNTWGTQIKMYVHPNDTNDLDELHEAARVSPTEFIINETSNDYDFRVESDNNANMLLVDAENDRVKIGSSTGSAHFNVVIADSATDPLLGLFQQQTNNKDARVQINTQANDGGDPYIKFDAGGSNMIVGLHWKGTTNNELRMGAAERPNDTIKGVRVKGNGSTFISTTNYEGQLDGSNTGVLGHAWNASSGSYVLQRYQNSTGAESIIVNNIHSVGASIGMLQYRTRNTVEGSLNGTSSGLAISNVSDYRKKENVADATGCLNRIDGLRPVTYTHRSEYDSDTTTVHTGFIAHEVSDHLPSIVNGTKDAVDEDGNVALQSVAYADHEMIANLVGAIKELKAENDAMRLRLDALEGA
jgi:hypothetical protein